MSKILRWIPFAVIACASLWAAGHAPDGRRAPEFQWAFDIDAVMLALTKVKHMGSTALIFALAVLALGPNRLGTAAILTFLVGVLWEVLQTTVIGHNARLADLVPNAVGIAAAWTAVLVIYVPRRATAR